MTARGLVLAAIAAAAAALVAGEVYGAHAARETFEILLPLGALTVGAARLLVLQRERAGGLRRQVLLAAALVTGQLLVAVGLFALGGFCAALPGAAARGAGEMERPIASSLAWTALALGAGVGLACSALA